MLKFVCVKFALFCKHCSCMVINDVITHSFPKKLMLGNVTDRPLDMDGVLRIHICQITGG